MQDSPNNDISLVTVTNEKELLKYDLDRISEEVTGKPVDRIFPIYVVFNRGKFRGFFQAIQQTVIYPAIHPSMMGPHEYVKVMSSLVTEIKRTTGNPLFMACKRADELSAETIRAIGVKRADENAYVYCEET